MSRYTLLVVALGATIGCDLPTQRQPQASSGVRQSRVEVPTDQSGHTAEQRNIAKRLVEDNRPGSVKFLYIISAYSGQVIFFSTVDGKVTSGGKRLTPTTVAEGAYSIPFRLGGATRYTNEVIQDDGAYGHSGDYLYWWDTQGRYFQYYITGGVIPLISSQQLAVNRVIINVEGVDDHGNTAVTPTPPPPPAN